MRPMRTTLLLVAVVGLAASPSLARSRRHHHAAAVRRTAPDPQAAPFMFYPEHIEGGVDGNLSFNNQIRKHTDPLNANGGK